MSNYTTTRKLRFYNNLSETLLSENISSGELSSLITQIRNRQIVNEVDIAYLRILKESYPNTEDFRDAILNLVDLEPRVEANTLAISLLLKIVETLSESTSINFSKIEELTGKVDVNTVAIAENKSDIEAMANVIVDNAHNIIQLRQDLTLLEEKTDHIEQNVNVIEGVLHDLAGQLAILTDAVANHEVRITKLEEEVDSINNEDLGKIKSFLDFKEIMGEVVDHTTEEIGILKNIAVLPTIGSCQNKGNTPTLKTLGYMQELLSAYTISLGIPDISTDGEVIFGYRSYSYNVIYDSNQGIFTVNNVAYAGVPVFSFLGRRNEGNRLIIWDATINTSTKRVKWVQKAEHEGDGFLETNNNLMYRWIYSMVPAWITIRDCYYVNDLGEEVKFGWSQAYAYQRDMMSRSALAAEYEVALLIFKTSLRKEIESVGGEIKENVMSRLLAGIVQVVNDSDLVKIKLTPIEEKVSMINTINRVCPPVSFKENSYSWGSHYDNTQNADEMTESLVDRGMQLKWSEKIDSIMNVAILNARYGGSQWPHIPVEIAASQTTIKIQGQGNYDGQSGEPITGNISPDISENDLDMGWRIRRAVKSEKQELIATTWIEKDGACEMRWMNNYRRSIDKGFYENALGHMLQWYPQCSGPHGENEANALARLCVKVTFTETVTVYKNEEHLNISNVGGTIKIILDSVEQTQIAREMYVPNVSINMRTIGATFEIKREMYAVIKPIINSDIPHNINMGIGNGCAHGYALWKNYITMKEKDGYELEMLDLKDLDMTGDNLKYIAAMGTTITPAYKADKHPTYLDGGTIEMDIDPLQMSIHWYNVDKLEQTAFDENDFLSKTTSRVEVDIDITYDGQFDYAKREISWNANWEEGDYSVQKMINTAIISQVGEDILQNEITIANIIKSMKSSMHEISWKVILEHLSGALLSGLVGLPGLGTVIIEAAKEMKDIVESIINGFNEDVAMGMVTGLVAELLAALEVATKVNENIQGVISHVQQKSQEWQQRIEGFKEFLTEFNSDSVAELAKGMMTSSLDYRTLGNDIIGTIESSIGISDDGKLNKIITRVNKDMATGIGNVTQKVLKISSPSIIKKLNGVMLFSKEGGGFTLDDLFELFSWNMNRGHVQSSRLRQAINSYDTYTVQEYGKYIDGKLNGKTAVIVSEKHQQTAISFGSDKGWW